MVIYWESIIEIKQKRLIFTFSNIERIEKVICGGIYHAETYANRIFISNYHA